MNPSQNRYTTYRPAATQRASLRTPTVPAPRRRRSPQGLVIVAVIVGLVAALFAWKPTSTTGILASTTNKPEQPVKKMPPIINTQSFAPQIDAIIAANPSMQIGVAYVDLSEGSHGEVKQQGVQSQFIAASVSKLVSAIYYFHNEETGNNTAYRKRTDEEFRRLIVESDNNVWIPLNDDLGRPAMEAYAKGLGMTSYTTTNNMMTTADAAILLQKFYKRDLLNEQHTTKLLALMEQAERNEIFAPTIPAGVKVYHKAGWLEDRLHNVAIVDNGKHPYAIVIFSKSNVKPYNSAKGLAALQGISKVLATGFITSPTYLPQQ